MRWLVSGMWSGYVSAQTREVHRETIEDRTLADAIQKLGSIRFTDGTLLYLFVREMGRGERVNTLNGYGRLIRDCVRHGVNSVRELPPS